MKRASSTKIRVFLDCQRRAVFEFADDKPVVASLPMALGTVTHAILEQRTAGLDDSEAAVREMVGNYDDPREALDAFPDDDVYGIARETADVVGPHPLFAVGEAIAAFDENFDGILESTDIEYDLEEQGLKFACGTDAGGYIDLLIRLTDDRFVVWDWKTRGRLDYIPRTEADFRADPQLCYYAAALLRCLPEDERPASVLVGHGNLLRADKPGGPKFVPVIAEIPSWYLDSVWEYLEGVAADMTVAMAQPPAKAARNPNQCYKYGACPHLDYCQSGDRPRTSFFAWAKTTNLDHLVKGD